MAYLTVDGSTVHIALPVTDDNVTHYEVWRSADGSTGAAVRIASSVVSMHTDTTVVAGATYYYFIKACTTAGCTDFELGLKATLPN